MKILSQRKCIKLATQVGRELVKISKTEELNEEKIRKVCSNVLQGYSPEIITTTRELAACLRNTGINEQEIIKLTASAERAGAAAMTVANGRKPVKIYIPPENNVPIQTSNILVLALYAQSKAHLKKIQPACVAHEVEHALEKNFRLSKMLGRYFFKINKFLTELFCKDVVKKSVECRDRMFIVGNKIQDTKSLITKRHSGLSIIEISCDPTIKGIATAREDGKGKSLGKIIRNIIRKNFISAENQAAEAKTRYKSLLHLLNVEIPAYKVAGKIERMIFNPREGAYSNGEIISKIYRIAKHVVEMEYDRFKFNKTYGLLKKPSLYTDDKDVYSYAAGNKKSKKILSGMIDKMTFHQKNDLVKFLYAHQEEPELLSILKQFIEATTTDDKCRFIGNLGIFKHSDAKLLKSPAFVDFANNYTGSRKRMYKILKEMSQLNESEWENFLAKFNEKGKKIEA